MKQFFKCQDNLEEIMSVSPWLLMVLADCILWAEKEGLTITVTSLLRESDDGISESTTHQEGRAMDLSVKGWNEGQIRRLSEFLNRKYASLIGTAKTGALPRVCYYHNNGNGWHFHLQVRRSIATDIKIQLTR